LLLESVNGFAAAFASYDVTRNRHVDTHFYLSFLYFFFNHTKNKIKTEASMYRKFDANVNFIRLSTRLFQFLSLRFKTVIRSKPVLRTEPV
jgi:hypothetical protein